jgi:hypothetical protein
MYETHGGFTPDACWQIHADSRSNIEFRPKKVHPGILELPDPRSAPSLKLRRHAVTGMTVRNYLNATWYQRLPGGSFAQNSVIFSLYQYWQMKRGALANRIEVPSAPSRFLH